MLDFSFLHQMLEALFLAARAMQEIYFKKYHWDISDIEFPYKCSHFQLIILPTRQNCVETVMMMTLWLNIKKEVTPLVCLCVFLGLYCVNRTFKLFIQTWSWQLGLGPGSHQLRDHNKGQHHAAQDQSQLHDSTSKIPARWMNRHPSKLSCLRC